MAIENRDYPPVPRFVSPYLQFDVQAGLHVGDLNRIVPLVEFGRCRAASARAAARWFRHGSSPDRVIVPNLAALEFGGRPALGGGRAGYLDRIAAGQTAGTIQYRLHQRHPRNRRPGRVLR
jgi:hypothetical protein